MNGVVRHFGLPMAANDDLDHAPASDRIAEAILRIWLALAFLGCAATAIAMPLFGVLALLWVISKFMFGFSP